MGIEVKAKELKIQTHFNITAIIDSHAFYFNCFLSYKNYEFNFN